MNVDELLKRLARKRSDHFQLIDLAQKTMDGFKDDVAGSVYHKGGSNHAATMMAGMPHHVTALLWALVRSTEPDDRYFYVMQSFLTSELRPVIATSGIKLTKLKDKDVAKGVARSALAQFLFNKGQCAKCHGLGVIKNDRGYIECPRCDGYGEGKYTQSEQHKLSGLPVARQVYFRVHEQFERQAKDILNKWRADLDAWLRGYFYKVAEEHCL